MLLHEQKTTSNYSPIKTKSSVILTQNLMPLSAVLADEMEEYSSFFFRSTVHTWFFKKICLPEILNNIIHAQKYFIVDEKRFFSLNKNGGYLNVVVWTLV